MRRIMADRGIGVSDLATMVGISAAAICRYAQGVRTPAINVAYRIAYALRCDVREVFPPILGAHVKRAS